MRFVPGQKCLIAWGYVLMAFVALVLYLDSYDDYLKIEKKDRNNENAPKPIFLAIVLFIMDISACLTICYSSHKEAETEDQKLDNLTEIWIFLWPRRMYIVGQFAVIILKAIGQILLFLRLIFHIQIPYFLIFLPFWALLLIILGELTRRLHSIQKSA